MTSRHTQPSPSGDKLATIAVVVAVGAVLIGFFAPSLAIFLALVALVLAILLLVRSSRGPRRRGVATGTVVAAFLAFVVAGANMPAPEVDPVAAPPVADPNALPATVLVASAQSPDNLVTNAGRRLHVTMMQGYAAADACGTGSDRATANELVAGKTVRIAAPDALRLDDPSAVPPGFQSVVLTLPDGRDYAQAWTTAAPRNSGASCTTTSPTTTTETTTTEPAPTTTVEEDVDVDVDRPYVPAPGTKARSGQSGHPCLAGERDGDGDGFCGE